MAIIVIGPEVGVAMAMSQYLYARESQAKKSEQAEAESEKEIEAVENEKIQLRILLPPSPDSSEQDRKEEAKGGIEEVTNEDPDIKPKPALVEILLNSGPLQGNQETSAQEIFLNLKDWMALDPFRKELPDCEILAEEDIQDRSKADAFTKAFACLQSI
ncbi:hypothetical protein G7Y89_g6657 [Cudoniella acicularis]|uniref:Uncharacterized protein n=1 Tax=Cudoniella acicularis TaxID=354080 RepID=A0A8H4RK09_9HELO|nr:hypothetical protein G7Y89_g6657 [Cudoniella acicularis]